MLDAREHGAPHEVGNPLVDLNLVEQLATLRKTVDLPAILERPAASVQVAAVRARRRTRCKSVCFADASSRPARGWRQAWLAPLPALPPK